MSTDYVGQVFAERYRVIRRIGEGGSAIVFEALDGATGESVALKIVHTTESSARAERFRRELVRLRGLQHPHIVRCFDGGQTPAGELYAVFELLGGVDVSDRMEQGAIAPEMCEAILVQVLRALSAAHATGVLHRDVKPSNIRLVSERPHTIVKLLDFGIATAIEGEEDLTETGKAVGTPRFMSPEQWLGEPLTPASDIYSLGLVAYDMLCGTFEPRPMDPGVRVAIPVNAGLPSHLTQLVNRMLVPSPQARFGSCEEVLHALMNQAATTQPSFPQPSTRLSEAMPAVPTPQSSTLVEPAAAQRKPERPWASYFLVGVAAVGVMAAVTLFPSLEEPAVVTQKAAPVEPPTIVEEVELPPPEPEEEPMVGCQPHEPGMHTAKKVDGVSLVRRTATYYVPSSYDPAQPPPLLVVIFDAAEIKNLMRMAMRSGFPRVAEEHGFVVTFVRVLSHDRAREEILGEIDVVASKVCVDRERVVAVGSKAGGGLLIQNRCSLGLRAMATLGTRELNPVCGKGEEIPHIHFAQRHDTTAPFKGFGCRGRAPSMGFAPFEKIWTSRYQCGPTPATGEPYGMRGHCRIYDGCDVPLEICEVNGGPVWVERRKCSTPEPSGFDYAEASATFLSRFL